MKEINPIGIRLAYTKLWRFSFVERKFNYSYVFKNNLTLVSRISNIVQKISYFFVFIMRSLSLYYKFLKKKLVVFIKYLFFVFPKIPTKLTALKVFLSKNKKSFFFFFGGYSKFKLKTKTISLILFYFFLVKRYLLNSTMFVGFSGCFFFEINFTAVIAKFKVFKKKFLMYKSVLLKKRIDSSKVNHFKKGSLIYKKYRLFLTTKIPFVSLSKLYNFVKKIASNNLKFRVFRYKNYFFLKRILRKRFKFKLKYNYYKKKFSRKKFFLKPSKRKRNRIALKKFFFLKTKKNQQVSKKFLKRIRTFNLKLIAKRRKRGKKHRKFLRKRVKIVKFLEFRRKSWFFLKRLFLKKLRQLRFKFLFLRKVSLKYKVKFFSISKKIFAHYFLFFTQMLKTKTNNTIMLSSNKLFILYNFYLKYSLENFFRKNNILGQTVIKFYFKNLYNYIKTDAIVRTVFRFFKKTKSKFYRKMVKRYFFYVQLMNIFILAIYTRNARLLTVYLSSLFVKTKRHNKILKDFSQLVFDFFLYIPVFLGVKLQMGGKFHGKSRAAKRTLHIYRNLIPILSFNAFIDYHFCNVDTYTGTFGLHVWLYYN
jgi:hypothetical protein